MSAVRTGLRTEFGGAERRPAADPIEREGLSGQAKTYLAAVAVATVIAAFVPLSRLSPDTEGWMTFIVLATCAAVAQLFVVRTPRDQSYHTTNVFLIPAALLLPPELVALMGIALIPEWLKIRYP